MVSNVARMRSLSSVGLGGLRLLVGAQRPTLVLKPLRLVVPTVAPELAHLLGEVLHLVPQIVSFGPERTLGLVQLQHLVDHAGILAPAEQPLADDVGIAADGTHVEHPPTVAPLGLVARRFPPVASPDVPAIEIENLTVRHGDLVAVDDVSLTADAGATLALLGPNGAGKTTLIETLEGYRRPDGGSVRVLGLEPFDQHDQLVGRIGVMLQNGGIQTGIRPVEAMQLYAALADDPLDPDDLLERVGLTGRSRTTWRNLSGENNDGSRWRSH